MGYLKDKSKMKKEKNYIIKHKGKLMMIGTKKSKQSLKKILKKDVKIWTLKEYKNINQM